MIRRLWLPTLIGAAFWGVLVALWAFTAWWW